MRMYAYSYMFISLTSLILMAYRNMHIGYHQSTVGGFLRVKLVVQLGQQTLISDKISDNDDFPTNSKELPACSTCPSKHPSLFPPLHSDPLHLYVKITPQNPSSFFVSLFDISSTFSLFSCSTNGCLFLYAFAADALTSPSSPRFTRRRL